MKFHTQIAEYGSPEFQACLEFEKVYFGGFFGLTPDEMIENYEKYDVRSWFVYCVNSDGVIVGAARMIEPSKDGETKTFKDLVDPEGPWGEDQATLQRFFDQLGIDLTTMVDFSTYRIRRDILESDDEARLVMASIMANVYHGSLDRGIKGLVAAYDVEPLGFYRSLGLEYLTISDLTPRFYLGSTCEPVYNNFDRMSTQLKEKNPFLWDLIVGQKWKG